MNEKIVEVVEVKDGSQPIKIFLMIIGLVGFGMWAIKVIKLLEQIVVNTSK